MWISTKSRVSRAARKPATAAAEIRSAADRVGCRSAVGALSSWVGRLAVSAGRYRSNGGGTAGGPSGRTVGSVSSTPAGAVSFAVTVAVTSTTVSSGSFSSSARTAGSVTTTWARPVASRTIRKATDLSSRRRCTQPAIRTVAPIRVGRWWDRVRCMAGCSSVDRHAFAALGWRSVASAPGRCGRAGTSRCHHTFTPAEAGASFVA